MSFRSSQSLHFNLSSHLSSSPQSAPRLEVKQTNRVDWILSNFKSSLHNKISFVVSRNQTSSEFRTLLTFRTLVLPVASPNQNTVSDMGNLYTFHSHFLSPTHYFIATCGCFTALFYISFTEYNPDVEHGLGGTCQNQQVLWRWSSSRISDISLINFGIKCASSVSLIAVFSVMQTESLNESFMLIEVIIVIITTSIPLEC